jgi:hypothetical protein
VAGDPREQRRNQSLPTLSFLKGTKPMDSPLALSQAVKLRYRKYNRESVIMFFVSLLIFGLSVLITTRFQILYEVEVVDQRMDMQHYVDTGEMQMRTITSTKMQEVDMVLIGFLVGSILTFTYLIIYIFRLKKIWTCPSCHDNLAYENRRPKITKYCPNCGIQLTLDSNN